MANRTPIMWRRHLESMRAVSIPPRRCSALDEHPAAAERRSIASTGPLLLGYGAGKEVHKAHTLRTKSSSHSSKDAFHAFQSTSLFTTILSSSGAIGWTNINRRQAISSFPNPSFGPAPATAVAKKVFKSPRRAKARPTLVFRVCVYAGVLATRRPVPTSLNAETAAARLRQALAFPIPCG
ncbi:hypothetical protein FB451DRAFT_1389305 [Mycena latifolia]|nr:hypothetical protein FB451DRAFT_1389305 [Mycena latifolia]